VIIIVAASLWHVITRLIPSLAAIATTPQAPRSISFRGLSHENHRDYSLHPAPCLLLRWGPALPSLSSQAADDLPHDLSSLRDENSSAILRLVSLVSHVSNSWRVKEISRAAWAGAADCTLPACEERHFRRPVRWRDKRDEASVPAKPAP
jgi:hypothetical protein